MTPASESRTRVEAALAEVSAAEESLERSLRQLEAAPRAEKVVVTDMVKQAFGRLRSAREVVASLQTLVAGG